ncbi:putative reverse transcriptase domain-containing protein [Tanacetum coccineum]|uniref:Reverse transcriptase domain-containing protein n=1 Tax=Tanacetum coccineum TaxID=301880 RepID=A0ABQ5FXP9_9ASTR
MPVELGSFDAIIGMDWLSKYQAVIVCAEKIVSIPWGNETLIIYGDGSNQGNATRLNIISCTKTQKYMQKGFPIFLAHVTAKEVEDKSEKKRLEDVPIVRDFPEVFPEDLPGLLDSTSGFQIESVPGVAPVVGASTLPIVASEERVIGATKTSSSSVYSKVTKLGISPTEGSRRRHSEDCLQNSLRPYEFQNKQEHEKHLKLILELLRKKEFEGIHVDPAKIESYKDWASPKSPTEIRQFLGLVGYYRRFIKGFSKIAKPMTKLTQKKVKFVWGNTQEAVFQLLKQKLCSAPILALLEGSEDFITYCDASKKGLGAVLMQRGDFLCITPSLQHILDQKELNMRQTPAVHSCSSDYDCDIRYHPGKANVVADALSRKEREPPLRVRALVMTISLDLPKQILNAQTEARNQRNDNDEDVRGCWFENANPKAN